MPIVKGLYGTANAVTTTTADSFIPAVWSNEIVAAYEQNLVMANLVRKLNHTGKKGDALNIPMPTRGSATQKSANTMVSIQQDTESVVTVSINRHFEYSRLIEDIVTVQALDSLRQFYTQDAGYALARQVDLDLIQLGRSANNGAGTNVYANAFIAGDGTTAFNGTNANAITDAGLRRMIQRLDDNDVPMDRRYLVIPPSSRNTLMGIARFTEQGFTGETGAGNTIRNGQIGDLYGVKIFVTPQCDTAAGAQGARIGLLFHEDAFVLAEQMGVRTQTSYKLEYLADLMTADTLYGVQLLRRGNDADVPAAAFPIAVAP